MIKLLMIVGIDRSSAVLGLAFASILAFPLSTPAAQTYTIRVGHFPNITHAQAVIAHGLARSGNGWFEQRLGPNVKVEWLVFNAGPGAMEAIFTQRLDLAYVGPNPAINAHVRSRGTEVRILSGACSGGAALVVRQSLAITNSSFAGLKVGTPQLGNTQDVAARAWLKSKGHRVTLTGGDALVVPATNADLFALFKTGFLDAVWTTEPWVSKLVLELDGNILHRERDLWTQTKGRYVTTHLASRADFLRTQPQLVRKWVKAHVELTLWINENPQEAKRILNEELKSETTRALPAPILDRAWEEIELTWDPLQESLLTMAQAAYEARLLPQEPKLSQLYELTFLNEVLQEKKLPALQP